MRQYFENGAIYEPMLLLKSNRKLHYVLLIGTKVSDLG